MGSAWVAQAGFGEKKQGQRSDSKVTRTQQAYNLKAFDLQLLFGRRLPHVC